jgi:GTP-binding protein
MKKIVAIFGRPNVGKSTLFNRLVGERIAIVHPESGVTRDRNYGEVEWTGKSFFLIDTGGYVPRSEDKFEKAIREQVKIAIEESDKIIFVVDMKNGIHPVDKELAALLRKYADKKQIILAVNKADNLSREIDASEFYEMGLGEPIAISALVSRNIGDLLDIIVADLEDSDEEEDNRIKFALIGRPNVGKSSIINAILKEEKNIVTDIPGTTRDSIDSTIKYHGEDIVLIDTAGLRRKAKIKKDESLEFFSTVRSYKAIQRCDVALLVLDATMMAESLDKASDHNLAVFKLDKQDIKIMEEIVKYKKGLLIVINKWDLITKDSKSTHVFEKKILEHLKSFDFLKIIFISALTKQRIHKILEEAMVIYNERQKKIKTSELNKIIQEDIKITPPQAVRGKEIKINYITQLKSAPPVFAFFSNEPKLIQANYKKFLERKLRQRFGFKGVPIGMVFKRKNEER